MYHPTADDVKTVILGACSAFAILRAERARFNNKRTEKRVTKIETSCTYPTCGHICDPPLTNEQRRILNWSSSE